MTTDPFNTRDTLDSAAGPVVIYRLDRLESDGIGSISRLPFSTKILIEAALRQLDGFEITEEHIRYMANWDPANPTAEEIPFKPARVVLQDFTGVPSVVDLAALRSAMARLGGDPTRINPQVPVDLVIDHSVQVDRFGSRFALMYNAEREFERNRERYEFLRWGRDAFDNFTVVPPATGIVHQVNLEYLAKVVQQRQVNGEVQAMPDTLVGTDSHTTMINGLGVLGWGVGGIEAEAAMLGQPIFMLMPQVIGFRLTGGLREGATATDLVLTVTQMLREKGVVGKFVEFFGSGISRLTLADRATISNMAPEYGATIGFFPVDDETLNYLRSTNRSTELVDLVERYSKEQGLFRSDDSADPIFTDTLELDLADVEPSMAGPKRPQDRIALSLSKDAFLKVVEDYRADNIGGGDKGQNGHQSEVALEFGNVEAKIRDGSVVIAAITSCTNTSNPTVMVGAGLVAKKAVEAGLDVPPYVKTSLAPGSKVVTRYLERAGLMPYLEALRFHLVGYGCTTCIGNSGPISPAIGKAVTENDLVVASVSSGNRNFEGRIPAVTRANYLASPPLVVAYALAGRMDIDLENEPIGTTINGEEIYLRDIWPTHDEIQAAIDMSLSPDLFAEEYANVYTGNETWNAIKVPEGAIYDWDETSTYIQEPPFFTDLTPEEPDIQPISGARVLALLGDSITTDHISPAGSIPQDGPAAQYLLSHNIERPMWNSFGSRRGNHEVMMRGTFANVRLRNHLAPGTEGGYAPYHPTGDVMHIFDAAMKYKADGTSLIVIAGKDYGMGSSRDWAAKGTILLGVKAAIAESFERIHRSNLIGMGVLPLQFQDGQNAASLGLTGHETFDIEGLDNSLQPRQTVTVKATDSNGNITAFETIVRIDSPVEVKYYRNGGILHAVLRDMLHSSN
ncbi:MAG: aconitate hydratase AcnA [Chloroflexi bacterium]|nr:aconitate hydratase AcnA [Chloroflexota bacterium]